MGENSLDCGLNLLIPFIICKGTFGWIEDFDKQLDIMWSLLKWIGETLDQGNSRYGEWKFEKQEEEEKRWKTYFGQKKKTS